MERTTPGSDDERALVAALGELFGKARRGETWAGDDAAVLDVSGIDRLLFSTDTLVEGVHFDLQFSCLEDVGARALAVNLSDIAAMGGTALAALAAVAGANATEVARIAVGLRDEAVRSGCPVVGGNVSKASELSVVVAIVGSTEGHPVLRSGATPGDLVYLTGPLGAAAAGLRALRGDSRASGTHVDAYRHPHARLDEGRAAAVGGASAMIDISDGFALDLDRLASASGVGVEIDMLPVADSASEQDAIGGGDDYELLFTARDDRQVCESFRLANAALPLRIGRIVEDKAVRRLVGKPLAALGYLHRLA